jgi:hypothetical protein
MRRTWSQTQLLLLVISMASVVVGGIAVHTHSGIPYLVVIPGSSGSGIHILICAAVCSLVSQARNPIVDPTYHTAASRTREGGAQLSCATSSVEDPSNEACDGGAKDRDDNNSEDNFRAHDFRLD